jgi:hypothetical protein
MTKPKRLWLWGPWLVFALLAAGWVMYRQAAAGAAEHELNAWFAEQRSGGAEVSCARTQPRGFPVLLSIALEECAYAPAGGDWRAHAARLDLNVNLVNPSHVIFAAKSPIEFVAGETRHVLSVDNLLLSLRRDGEALAQAGLEIDALELDNPDRDGEVRARKIVINVRPDPRAAGDYQMALNVEALALARPARGFERFGQEIETLSGAIVLTHGAALLDAPKSDAFGQWRAAGGRARAEGLRLAWGPLEAEGQGEIGLDGENRIEGRLDLDIDRPAPALRALAQSEGLDRDARRAIELIAAGFALTGQGASFDVEARDGRLRVENAPVRALSPIY